MPTIREVLGIAFLCLAVSVGGGGSPAPGSELIVEFAALLVLLIWLWIPYSTAAGKRLAPHPDVAPTNPMFAGRRDRVLIFGAIAIAAIPAMQVIPLPPAIWHALPNREIEIAALSLTGDEARWMPVSIAPQRTLAGLLALVPPMVMLFITMRLGLRGRTRLLTTLAALGIVAAIVGAGQLAGGRSELFRFYDSSQLQFASGFQANRNSGADVLLLAMLALAAAASAQLGRLRTLPGRVLIGAGFIILGLSVFLTGSRAGSGLLFAAAVASVLLFLPRLSLSRRFLLSAGAVIVVVGGLSYVLRDNVMLARTWERFGSDLEQRPNLWQDTIYAIEQYQPFGSGVSTFVPALTAAERLEAVDTSYPNRAHNDYLEYLLEGGVFAGLVMLAVLISTLIRVTTRLRAKPGRVETVHLLFGASALAILALHSLVDYPMRSLSIACIAAMAFGMLSRPATQQNEGSSPVDRKRQGMRRFYG